MKMNSRHIPNIAAQGKKKKKPPRANGSQKIFPWPLGNEEGVKAVKMFLPLLIPI